MKIKLGMWLCPICERGAPSGKICRKCLEAKLSRIEKLGVGEVLDIVKEEVKTREPKPDLATIIKIILKLIRGE